MNRRASLPRWWDRLRHSLAVKLYVPLFVLLVLLIGFQTRFMVQTSRRLFLRATEQDLQQGAEIFSRQLVEVLLFGDHDKGRLPPLVEEVRHTHGTPLSGQISRLLDGEGRRIGGDRGSGPVSAEYLLELATKGDTVHVLRGHRHPEVLAAVPNLPACQRCHKPEREVLAWVWAETPLEGLKTSEIQVKGIGIWSVILLSVILAFTLWLLLQSRIRRPLRRLEEAMERVSSGDLEARARIDLEDEIGQLARHFDEMVAQLQEADAELHRVHVEQMMRTERMVNVGEMASRMAHEIRNPLAGIEGVLSIFHEDMPEDDPERAILAEALSQVQRMKNALSDMLSFARPRPPQRVRTDVVELLEGLVKFCEQDRANQRHSIRLECEGEIPDLDLDPDQIGQAFLNVILNALQVMESPGEVCIRVERNRSEGGIDEVLVHVSDTGPGIPEDVRPHIFNAFYTTKTKGTGLGLAICRAAVRQHHADLELDRTGPTGTRFTFRFPVEAQAD